MEWQRRPPGGLLPGDPPRRDPRRWSAPTTGCRGRPNPHRRGRGAWTASSTWLKDLDPGRGGGLLEGRRVCARSGQQGGARGVLIVCCDGPAGLPEAARGDLARLHGPHLRGPPRSAPPVRFVAHKGPQGGRRRRAPEPAPPPTRRPPDEPRAPSASPTRAREHPQTAATWERAWERNTAFLAFPPALRRVICTTNAIESLNHRAARSAENRGHFPSDEAAVKLLWPAGLQHPRGRRAAQRAKDEEHARPLAQGQRVDSSTGRVTTNRSAPPAGPPGSPPPTPTESTPTSDRTRLHRNIDRLRPRRPRR